MILTVFINKWLKKNAQKEKNHHCVFELIKTPDNKGIIDAELYSVACFIQASDEIERHILGFLGYKACGRVSPQLLKVKTNKKERKKKQTKTKIVV